jgi:hypothetical protein
VSLKPRPESARFLKTALYLNLGIHVTAVIAMAACLVPGLPGGSSADVSERAAYVAEHPWLWRLGWLPWQLTAALDLVLAVALVMTRWVPRVPSVLTLLVTLAAIVPDQTGELLWVTHGIGIAGEAVRSGNPAAYQTFEAAILWQVGGVAGLLYLLMALGWTWCFAAAGTWSRALTWLSVPTWGTIGLSAVVLLLSESMWPAAPLLAALNAMGFALLVCWLTLITRQVVRRDTTRFPGADT